MHAGNKITMRICFRGFLMSPTLDLWETLLKQYIIMHMHYAICMYLRRNAMGYKNSRFGLLTNSNTFFTNKTGTF